MCLFQTWSREETDQLFDLCERFDLRFIVIADRFPTDRSVEDLKSRYYSGTSKLCCPYVQKIKLTWQSSPISTSMLYTCIICAQEQRTINYLGLFYLFCHSIYGTNTQLVSIIYLLTHMLLKLVTFFNFPLIQWIKLLIYNGNWPMHPHSSCLYVLCNIIMRD
jgi:hypothetical protein